MNVSRAMDETASSTTHAFNPTTAEQAVMNCCRCGLLALGREQPKMLPCLHTVCAGCFVGFQSATSMKCNICQLQFSLADVKNHVFPAEVQRCQVRGCLDKGFAVAAWKCEEESMVICERCKVDHDRTNLTNQHKLTKVARALPLEKCDTHTNKDAFALCLNCRSLKCGECAFDHREEAPGHTIERFATVEQKFSKVLKEEAENLTGLALKAKSKNEHIVAELQQSYDAELRMSSKFQKVFEGLMTMMRARQQELADRKKEKEIRLKQCAAQLTDYATQLANRSEQARNFASFLVDGPGRQQLTARNVIECAPMLRVALDQIATLLQQVLQLNTASGGNHVFVSDAFLAQFKNDVLKLLQSVSIEEQIDSSSQKQQRTTAEVPSSSEHSPNTLVAERNVQSTSSSKPDPRSTIRDSQAPVVQPATAPPTSSKSVPQAPPVNSTPVPIQAAPQLPRQQAPPRQQPPQVLQQQQPQQQQQVVPRQRLPNQHGALLPLPDPRQQMEAFVRSIPIRAAPPFQEDWERAVTLILRLTENAIDNSQYRNGWHQWSYLNALSNFLDGSLSAANFTQSLCDFFVHSAENAELYSTMTELLHNTQARVSGEMRAAFHAAFPRQQQPQVLLPSVLNYEGNIYSQQSTPQIVHQQRMQSMGHFSQMPHQQQNLYPRGPNNHSVPVRLSHLPPQNALQGVIPRIAPATSPAVIQPLRATGAPARSPSPAAAATAVGPPAKVARMTTPPTPLTVQVNRPASQYSSLSTPSPRMMNSTTPPIESPAPMVAAPATKTKTSPPCEEITTTTTDPRSQYPPDEAKCNVCHSNVFKNDAFSCSLCDRTFHSHCHVPKIPQNAPHSLCELCLDTVPRSWIPVNKTLQAKGTMLCLKMLLSLLLCPEVYEHFYKNPSNTSIRNLKDIEQKMCNTASYSRIEDFFHDIDQVFELNRTASAGAQKGINWARQMIAFFKKDNNVLIS